MKEKRVDIAVAGLRWVLGIVILGQTFAFLFAPESGHGQPHIPEAMRLILGWSEVVAALLFLLPTTLIAGGWLLIAVFAAALLIHVAHGQYGQVGGLVIYAAAVFSVMAHHKVERQKGSALN